MWVSAEMYSAPSIVLQSKRADGGVHVFDDFREAYAWLRHNTDPNSKVSPPSFNKRAPMPAIPGSYTALWSQSGTFLAGCASDMCNEPGVNL